MADSANITSFILRNVFSDRPADSNTHYRPSEIVGKSYDVTDTLTTFDFIDGDPANGDLRDAERRNTYHDNTTTQGSRIIVDDVEHYVQQIWAADIIFSFDNGESISIASGARLFILATENPNTMTGDIIVNPLDASRDKIYEYLKAHPGVKLKSYTVTGIIDDAPIDYTTIAEQDNVMFPCFAAGVLIETEKGSIAVENLKIDDMVLTLNNGYQPIRWISCSFVPAQTLAANPKLRPIRIETGALGNNCPSSPLIVSRQHRILIKSDIALKLFGAYEVLVPAIKLVGYSGIEIANHTEVTYYHILLDNHEILMSNGTFSESLYLGTHALPAISDEGLAEISTLFPEIVSGAISPPQSRPFINSKQDVKKILGSEMKARSLKAAAEQP